MLPSSHIPPIINFGAQPSAAALPQVCLEETGFPGQAVVAEVSPVQTAASAHALAEAFASFVNTSSRLEGAYRELQGEVSGLRVELAQRNTALKESLAENRRVRKALQQVVDSMPCGVLVVTPDGKLSTINPEAGRLLGLSAAPAGPASLPDVEALVGFDLQLAQFAQLDTDAEQEICWQTSTSERWLHVIVRRIADAAGSKPGHTLFILRDITAQKREEDHREAARNATALAEITTMLAHEIRNPLGSLELFATLIEQDAAGRDEWIANLRAGIRTLSGTVNNVLSLHDAGKLQLLPLDLNDVVSSTVRFALPMSKQATISLLCSGIAPGSRVMGNHTALQQVLLNLIRNAIRHTEAGGSITLATEEHGNQVLLHCSDTGSGIPAELLNRVFEPGFSGSGDSPGLGLAVCQRILKQHEGSISVTNIPGAGARFTLTLPTLQKELSVA